MTCRSRMSWPRKFRKNEDGVTAVEFAFVAPVLVVLMMGILDLGFQVYATSVLQGTLQNSARSATLENGFSLQSQIDAKLERDFKTVIPVGTVNVTRRNFQSFSAVVTPEDFTDTDGDGVCNNGEPFEDVNGNATWDSDRGSNGLGGARDVVLFTATATYQRMFPLAGVVPAISKDVTIEATTVLRNQPYNQQGGRAPTIESCA